VIGLPSLFDKFGLVRWAIQRLRILAAWRRKIKQKDEGVEKQKMVKKACVKFNLI